MGNISSTGIKPQQLNEINNTFNKIIRQYKVILKNIDIKKDKEMSIKLYNEIKTLISAVLKNIDIVNGYAGVNKVPDFDKMIKVNRENLNKLIDDIDKKLEIINKDEKKDNEPVAAIDTSGSNEQQQIEPQNPEQEVQQEVQQEESQSKREESGGSKNLKKNSRKKFKKKKNIKKKYVNTKKRL